MGFTVGEEMSSLSSKLAAKKFAFEDVSFCFDGDLNLEYAEARDALADANVTAATKRQVDTDDGNAISDQRLTDPADSKAVTTARKRVEKASQAIQDALITLRITAVSFGEYNKFIIQNPGRKGQEETYNPLTFFIFVARRTGKYLEADGTLSEITAEEWDDIEASLTDGDYDRLAMAVTLANRKNRTDGIDFLSSNSEETARSSENSEPLEVSVSPTDD